MFAFSSCEETNIKTNTKLVFEASKIEIPRLEIQKKDSLLSKNQKGLLLYKSQPFSGFLISTNQENVLTEKVGYYDGLKEGNAFTFFESGKIASERPYKSGKKHGIHKSWYENGQQRFEYTFVDGKSVGNHKVWYEDGSLFKDFHYKNGKPFGSQKVWRNDGKYRANYVIRENGKKYGLTGIKRCAKIDTKTENIDPYTGTEE